MKTKKNPTEKAMTPSEELDKMRTRLASIAREKAFLVTEEKEIQARLAERLSSVFDKELKARDKQYGEVTLMVDNNKVTMEVKKSVSWDSDLLYEVAKKMGPQRALQFMNIEAYITETNYAKISLTDPWLADINKARTVKYSAPKFSFPTKE